MTSDPRPQADAETEVGDEGRDASAWLDEHGDALYRYARLRVRRRELAEDLVQDTFLAAIQADRAFRGASSIRTWLLSILRHKIADYYRSRVGTDPTSIAAVDAVRNQFFDAKRKWLRPPGLWKSPDEALEDREFWGVIDACLSRLPRSLADVFVLRELEGRETDDVRRTLDLTASSLRVRLHRARLLLRECLDVRWFGNESTGAS